VLLEMEELATVKSVPPSVVMHSAALEPHSLFCTVYVPPPAGAVCELHSVVLAASADGPVTASAVAPAVVSTATTNGSMRVRPALR
jgi:hypothetical protein